MGDNQKRYDTRSDVCVGGGGGVFKFILFICMQLVCFVERWVTSK